MNSSQQSAQKSDRAVLREYYLEKNFFLSVEGILKVVSIVICIASSGAALAGGGCWRGAAGAGAGAATLAAAVLLAALCAVDALWLAAYAPMTCFYIDVVLSTALGLWLLTAGVLSLAFCAMQNFLDYLLGPLLLVGACTVLSSAVVTHIAVTRRWDAAAPPAKPDPPRPRAELEV